MKFNTDEAESSNKFKEGERYTLVVDSAEEGFATTGTPYLKLNLKTESGDSAYDHKIYNTPKAMFRAIEWLKAMGFKAEGLTDVDPGSLQGIKMTAVCVIERYTTDEPGGGKKEHAITKWDKPERVAIGGAPAAAKHNAAAKPAASKPAPQQEAENDDVPF